MLRLGQARALLGRRVTVVAGLAEGAAVDALLEGVAEAHRPPVLAAERVADLAPAQLALVLEEVRDQRQLTFEPPLVLVGAARRAAGERGVGAHRSAPVRWTRCRRRRRAQSAAHA